MSEEKAEQTEETPDVPEVLAPGLAMALAPPEEQQDCLLYTSPRQRHLSTSTMPTSA